MYSVEQLSTNSLEKLTGLSFGLSFGWGFLCIQRKQPAFKWMNIYHWWRIFSLTHAEIIKRIVRNYHLHIFSLGKNEQKLRVFFFAQPSLKCLSGTSAIRIIRSRRLNFIDACCRHNYEREIFLLAVCVRARSRFGLSSQYCLVCVNLRAVHNCAIST